MPEGYTHLTPDDRCQIEVLLKRGDSNLAIGRLLGRPASTIRREIARNTGLRGYRKRQAQLASSARRSTASRRAKKMTVEVIAGIEAKLSDEQWSPEQISGWMRRQETPGASGANHANAKPPWVSHERIHLPRIARQQGFQGVKIVTLYDQVAIKVNVANALLRMGHKRAKRH